MNVKFCDRCKRKINSDEKNKLTIINYSTVGYLLDKEMCEECTNNIINMIECECDRYKLDTVIRISKEVK